MRRRDGLVAVLAVLALAGTACGRAQERRPAGSPAAQAQRSPAVRAGECPGAKAPPAGSPAAVSPAATAAPGPQRTAKIGFIAPLTGPLGSFGQGMRNSALLAIEQANQAKRVPGWRLVLQAEDDAAVEAQGASAATKLASDPQVVAVIGTLNSSVAQAAQPALGQASIAMVSPANTNPTLTMGQSWQTSPRRQFPNYFRVVTTDCQQGRIAAEYAYGTLGKRRAVVMHDKKTYGQGLATIFAENFKRKGGQVLETIEINPGEGDYKPAVTRAKARNPDIIYFGGEFPEAGVIAKNMYELGMKAPDVILMGGDGIVDPKFIEIGGAGSEGMYATLVGASAELLPKAKAFVTAYRARFGNEEFSAFGPPTYDAANIIIDALVRVLPGKTAIDTSVRKAVVDAIQRTDHDGVLGRTTFNEFGDTTNQILTIRQVKGGKFVDLAVKRIT